MDRVVLFNNRVSTNGHLLTFFVWAAKRQKKQRQQNFVHQLLPLRVDICQDEAPADGVPGGPAAWLLSRGHRGGLLLRL